MKIFYKNLNKVYNSYNSGKKICFCNYNKISMIFFGYLMNNKIIKNYYIFYFCNKIYLLILINKFLFLKWFSKPSKKIFIKFRNIKSCFLNTGVLLITTNLGIINIKECIKLKIGGKLLFSVL
ncbi:putative ribosomal protein S8 [Candidatus Carsonella ruddii CS isolate Thao2000]|uniref:Small ribosomal subunit protein uS8 n=1 Tax=Candidatus Carsonella ruddii CS isolate Thao2000 TaxID=1202537 RepID=J7GST8_CARRU|nr:30S ribosomal protein S8 [Candidatus Carsonella ruddii]AFP83817.1 putative ribosomal protein S8 [Candidatus Carsonella ruddii CS isolate Thao2000]